jgi:hypothetical protein
VPGLWSAAQSMGWILALVARLRQPAALDSAGSLLELD